MHTPLKLKDTLRRHGISQPALANATRQKNGAPMSRSAMSFLLNDGIFPRGTPEHDIRRQIETRLAECGVGRNEIRVAWERADNGNDKTQTGRLPAAGKPLQDFDPLEAEMLTPLAKRHFKLFRDPFGDEIASPDEVFLAEDQRYIVEAMLQTAKAGGITAVIGESGSGKSTLRKLFLHRIAAGGDAIRMVFPQALDKSKLSTSAICTAIVKDIEPDSTVRLSLEAQARQVKDVLLRSHRAGNRHVLIIEEAHDLSIQTLKYLKRFYEIEGESGFGRVLSIILIAQPELRIKLDASRYPEAREFINRCEIATLAPLYEKLGEYIAHRLARHHVKPETIFATDAFDAIRARWTRLDPVTRAIKNNLYPLIINNTVTRAMNRAAELGMPQVTGELVKEL